MDGREGDAVATLVSFAGLPGSGKSTISRALSVATGAVYLRIDEIDAAIWALDPDRDIGPESYHIAAALAASNLIDRLPEQFAIEVESHLRNMATLSDPRVPTH